jgi:putative oxygen-independent coproporphyrinogen III oxidase
MPSFGPKALYVHIPFCSSICGYCDFTKLIANPAFIESYLPALFREIDSFHLSKVTTIYVGGGTPSVLSLPELKALLSRLSPFLEEGGEFTFEANPESLSPEKLRLLASFGVNRLSIGMQSSDPKLLGLMGRKHSYQDVVKAVAAAKEAGISNINVDLIYALPGENADLLAQDISALLALDVPHLSTYSLILEDDSIFKAKGISEASEDAQAEQYEQILKALRAAGYDRYEVSNFCREGKMSRHNLVYWHDEPYYAAGLGASGYIGNLRYRNTRSLQKYCAGQWREEEESVTPVDDVHYFLLTGLRLESGISLKAFADRFGFSFLTKYPKEVLKLKEEGLLDQKGDSLFATDRGIMLLDRILEELF